MHRSKRTIVLAIILVVGLAAWALAAGSIVDQKGVLAGTVLPNGLVTAGSVVREGTVLVVVDTMTGPAPAARANVDGRVKEVLVAPGDNIKTGQVLVRIDTSGK
ncbi:MAG: hypothetical protein H6Q73_3146 [Firmicutes bacterium]|nr:hypothetical protein [Bacillota bacterium]